MHVQRGSPNMINKALEAFEFGIVLVGAVDIKAD
jgi:hypothetical protein